MKNDLHTYLNKKGEEFALSADERARMRSVVEQYMEIKPLRAPASHEGRGAGAWGGWFFSPRPVALTLVLILFASSAGVTSAAEGSLPGDLLYPIKINVNEPVRGALALSSEARADWASKVAGTRIREVATLAAEGRLDATTTAAARASFESHAELAIQSIGQEASTSPDGSAEDAIMLESQLGEYERLLAEVGKSAHADVGALSSSVRAQGARVAELREHAERTLAMTDDSDKTISAARMRDSARARLDIFSNLARSAFSSLSPSSASAVALRLEHASATIANGEDLLGKNDAREALGAFRNALSATERLGVYLQTTSAIHARTGLIVEESDGDAAEEISASVHSGNAGISHESDVTSGKDDTSVSGTELPAAGAQVTSSIEVTGVPSTTTRIREWEDDTKGKSNEEEMHTDEREKSGKPMPTRITIPLPGIVD
ncbi:MAG: DUF5667 domain-containing protein [Patescibacteria group bacterium]|nr:DUF5667 domain-containing protein [bacterium]MDZ4226916.1 DUF5667 domain-containing protein [Patescibacteria group bacterium]